MALKQWTAGDKPTAAEMNNNFAVSMPAIPANNFGRAAHDGSEYLYVLVPTGSGTGICRWKLIGTTLRLASGSSTTQTWKDLSASYQNGVDAITYGGGYVWVWVEKTAGGNHKLLRITPADGTVVEMTISGTAPDDDSNNTLAHDGTYLYIADRSSTTVRKYSISGTTATYEAAITLSETFVQGLYTDGNYFWYLMAGDVLVKDSMVGAQQEKFETALSSSPGIFAIYNYLYGTYNNNTFIPIGEIA